MRNNILSGWNIMRILRLALGILIVIEGIQEKEWALVVLGVLFSAMPLLNAGCCGGTTCNTPAPKRSRKTEDISYEEVH